MKTGILNTYLWFHRPIEVQRRRLKQSGYSFSEFLEWGFDAKGSDRVQETWPRWNEKHKDLFEINGEGSMQKDLPRMVEQFMISKEKALGFELNGGSNGTAQTDQ